MEDSVAKPVLEEMGHALLEMMELMKSMQGGSTIMVPMLDPRLVIPSLRTQMLYGGSLGPS